MINESFDYNELHDIYYAIQHERNRIWDDVELYPEDKDTLDSQYRKLASKIFKAMEKLDNED